MGCMIQGSNPSVSKIVSTQLDQPWDPPSLLYNGYCVSFPGVKWPEHGTDHTLPSNAKVRERIELNLYTHSGPTWTILE